MHCVLYTVSILCVLCTVYYALCIIHCLHFSLAPFYLPRFRYLHHKAMSEAEDKGNGIYYDRVSPVNSHGESNRQDSNDTAIVLDAHVHRDGGGICGHGGMTCEERRKGGGSRLSDESEGGEGKKEEVSVSENLVSASANERQHSEAEICQDTERAVSLSLVGGSITLTQKLTLALTLTQIPMTCFFGRS